MRAGEAPSSIEPARGVPVDAPPPMGRDVLQERVAHELVAEPVAGGRRLDDQRGEGVVQAGVRVLLGKAGEGDELVGVERRPHHGHALEHLAGGRRDAADHGGVEGLHPARLPRGAAGQLVHRERHPAAEGGDLVDLLVRRGGHVPTDQGRDTVPIEGTEHDLGRAMAVDEALAGLGQDVAQRARSVGEDEADVVVARRPGDVVQEAKAGVVGVVEVVEGQQQAVRRRGEPDQLGRGHEQALVRAPAGPRRLLADQDPVDLLAVLVGQPVEQGRVAAAEVGHRLDDRRVGPRPLDRRRRPLPDAQAQVPGPAGERGQHRRLARSRRAR